MDQLRGLVRYKRPGPNLPSSPQCRWARFSNGLCVMTNRLPTPGGPQVCPWFCLPTLCFSRCVRGLTPASPLGHVPEAPWLHQTPTHPDPTPGFTCCHFPSEQTFPRSIPFSVNTVKTRPKGNKFTTVPAHHTSHHLPSRLPLSVPDLSPLQLHQRLQTILHPVFP